MCSKMADTYAHVFLIQFLFFQTQIAVKSLSGWIGPCSHGGQQMPVILFAPKPVNLHHIVFFCSFRCCCNDETERYYANVSDWWFFFEGQNRNKLFYDRVLSRVLVEWITGNVFFRTVEGHSCFTEIYL